jgi:lipid II:glycine glycyltransferase (peptidoglycan interpeptide bridge formation enzyme)
MRRADSAGVEVSAGGDLGPFYEVLKKNLSAKGAVPTHSLSELEDLFALFPDRMKLFEARLEGHVIGGVLIMLCNPRTALAFYVCVDPERKQLRVAERTLYECVEWLIELGYEHLDLGTVSIGGKVNWGLLEFKSKFLSRLYVRDLYSLRFGGRAEL